jgi:hypothetical protein
VLTIISNIVADEDGVKNIPLKNTTLQKKNALKNLKNNIVYPLTKKRNI